jgi:hypothetical protein
MRMGSVDLSTGEMMEGTAVWVGPKIRSPYGSRFYMSNQDALEAIAKDPEMTGQVLRVFLYLCSRLDFENYLQVPQVEIAQELEIGPTRVSEAIALLLRKGIVIRGPKVGASSVFRLAPHYGWKGKVTNLHKARATAHLRRV